MIFATTRAAYNENINRKKRDLFAADLRKNVVMENYQAHYWSLWKVLLFLTSREDVNKRNVVYLVKIDLNKLEFLWKGRGSYLNTCERARESFFFFFYENT